jgi:hypothetical protein
MWLLRLSICLTYLTFTTVCLTIWLLRLFFWLSECYESIWLSNIHDCLSEISDFHEYFSDCLTFTKVCLTLCQFAACLPYAFFWSIRWLLRYTKNLEGADNLWQMWKCGALTVSTGDMEMRGPDSLCGRCGALTVSAGDAGLWLSLQCGNAGPWQSLREMRGPDSFCGRCGALKVSAGDAGPWQSMREMRGPDSLCGRCGNAGKRY